MHTQTLTKRTVSVCIMVYDFMGPVFAILMNRLDWNVGNRLG